MPYPTGHRKKIREKIVSSARKLFNRCGFDGVSINQIMADAQLTRGAFYSYFQSKSDLYADTLACFFTDPHWNDSWKGVHIDLASVDIGPQIVRAYLSQQHLENVDNSCPMVALPSDVARSGTTAKRAFERVFKAMARTLESGLRGRMHSRRNTAQAIAALCVGGMVISRALNERAFANTVRKASLAVALHLGGWDRVSRSDRSIRRNRPLRRLSKHTQN